MKRTMLIQVIAAGLLCLYSVGSNARDNPEKVAELMQFLDARMIEVNRSLIWNDLGGLRAAARAIADHPTLPMGERARVLSRLGSDAAAFRALDVRMQESARGLADAATRDDREAVSRFHWELLGRCAECHRAFGHRLGGRGTGRSDEDG